MSEIEVIQSTLERTARRRRWQRALSGFWHVLFGGAAWWLVVLAFYKVPPLPDQFLWLAAAVVGALLPIGLLAGFWRKSTLLEKARWESGRASCRERGES